ncbi:MAG: 3-oxoacyl-[acyl-carrier-protein] synthase III [Myxococcota bacterium]|jgi:3-oxoacyl-[acyl-carrier-protein] synthase III
MRYQRVCIEGVGHVVPDTEVTTASIESSLSALYSRLGIRPGWLETVTGIRARRFWAPGVKPSQVATRAAERALDEAGISRESVGLLVSCSVCKDYLEPSTAALVHGNLSLPSRCLNFDVGNACLGFLSGLVVAANMIELGQVDVALVVAGESSREPVEATVRRLMVPGADMAAFRDNLATLTLGSAGVAMVLTSDRRTQTSRRFLGGLSLAATEFNRLCVGTATKMTTDPARLLAEGVKLAGRTWAAVHQHVDLRPEVVQSYALHQVGRANHQAVIRALSLPPERALALYPDHGNVGAAGVPLTLALSAAQGRLRPGDRVGMLGIGSGLNVSMMGAQW